MYEPDRELHRMVESALISHLPRSTHFDAEALNDALRYAVFPGGKRLRPKLTLLTALLAGEDMSRALPCACAVEFVHSSSLIFDDLPCMDDTALRRGNPALHVVFGEGIAVLAGIALLNEAYAIFGRTPGLLKEAAQCIGVNGMIGGQSADLRSSPSRNFQFVERNRKTSALMRLAFIAGPWACGTSPRHLERLGCAGEYFGAAYQMLDDLTDLTAELTLDPEGNQKRANELVAEGRALLVETFGPGDGLNRLMAFVNRIVASAAVPLPEARLVNSQRNF